MQLFSKYVHDVELENHSYCNRTCWFCPNSFIDRRSQIAVMSDTVFEKIVSNLEEIRYSGILEWSGYAEHFAEPSFLTRLKHAREALPHARPIVFTNGDYLNREIVGEIRRLNIRLHVDIYPPEGEEFNAEKIAVAIAKFTNRTKLQTRPLDGVRQGWGEYELELDGQPTDWRMKVGRYSKEIINSRGGSLDIPKTHIYQRTAVCMKPIYHININYDGKGMLCCNTRSDYAPHKEAIIADLARDDEDLFTFFAKLAPARRALLAPGKKEGVCLSCDDDADGNPRGPLARTELGATLARAAKKLLRR